MIIICVALLWGIHDNLLRMLLLGMLVSSSISMIGTWSILHQSLPLFSWQLSNRKGHSLMYSSFNDFVSRPGKHGMRGHLKMVIAVRQDASSRPAGKQTRLLQSRISSFCRVAGSFTGKDWRLAQSAVVRCVSEESSLSSWRRGLIRLEHELMRKSSSLEGSKLCCPDGASLGQS